MSRSGSGDLVTVAGSAEPTASSGRLLAYRVLVEDGLTVSGQAVEAAQFARLVHEILTDERGWQSVEGVRFARVDHSTADLDVVLASPDTTDRLCAPLQTAGVLSCFNGAQAVINARRWFASDDSYGDDLTNYRRYLISHEVGHDLGYGHVGCPEPGAQAPVMMQQTKSLDGCLPNPWPAPP